MTEQKKALSASDILKAQDHAIEPVDCPEWGGTVYVREMSEKAYMEWIEESREGGSKASSGLLRRTMCDEGGTLLFSADDVEKLREKSLKPLNRVADAALKVNGLKIKDEEALVGKLSESDSPTD